MLNTLTVAITLSQQTSELLLLLYLIMLLLQMQREILTVYRPKRRNWFCEEITHILLCKENTGYYKKRAGSCKDREEEKGGTKLG